MCVIALVQTEAQRLSKDQITKMFEANDFGAGVVWINDKDKTQWIKGLDEGAVQEVVPTLPLPYAVHFRNPSPNTSLSDLVCHPFSVDEDADPSLQGETEGFVLMHNGFWTDWKNKVIELATKGGWQIPAGPWSDSRALALVAHHLGQGAIELIGEKVLMFSAGHIETHGSGWTTVKATDLIVSNLTWEGTVHRPHQGHGQTHGSFAGNMYTTPPASMAGGNSGTGSGGRGTTGTDTSKATDKGSAGGDSRPVGFRSTLGQEEQTQTQALTQPGTSTEPSSFETSAGQGSDDAQAVSQGDETVERTGGRNRPFTGSELKAWAASCQNGTTCQDCNQRVGHLTAFGVRRCWPCWDEFQAKERQGPTQYDVCDYCNKLHSTMITLATAKWVCNKCWSENGRPDAIREKDTNKKKWEEIMTKRRLREAAHAEPASKGV